MLIELLRSKFNAAVTFGGFTVTEQNIVRAAFMP